jgi:hypothetical protein
MEADLWRAGRCTKERDEGKLKTGGLEPRATALAGRPVGYYPWDQPGTVGILWLDLDHTDSIKVTVAKKADGASFDTGIWAVGGDAAGLEEAREAIRDGLHVKWRQNLRKEGVALLVKHGCGDPSEDQVRDWVPKTMVFKRGKRIRKGPGMPCVD